MLQCVSCCLLTERRTSPICDVRSEICKNYLERYYELLFARIKHSELLRDSSGSDACESPPLPMRSRSNTAPSMTTVVTTKGKKKKKRFKLLHHPSIDGDDKAGETVLPAITKGSSSPRTDRPHQTSKNKLFRMISFPGRGARRESFIINEGESDLPGSFQCNRPALDEIPDDTEPPVDSPVGLSPNLSGLRRKSLSCSDFFAAGCPLGLRDEHGTDDQCASSLSSMDVDGEIFVRASDSPEACSSGTSSPAISAHPSPGPDQNDRGNRKNTDEIHCRATVAEEAEDENSDEDKVEADDNDSEAVGEAGDGRQSRRGSSVFQKPELVRRLSLHLGNVRDTIDDDSLMPPSSERDRRGSLIIDWEGMDHPHDYVSANRTRLENELQSLEDEIALQEDGGSEVETDELQHMVKSRDALRLMLDEMDSLC